MMIVLLLGTALLTKVNAQSSQSGAERAQEGSFQLADGALTAQLEQLEHAWPASASPYSTCNQSAAPSDTCMGTELAPNYTALAAGAPNGGTDFASQPQWSTRVIDDADGPEYYDDDLATTDVCACDENGNGSVWVRAEANVGGKRAVLVSLASQGDPRLETLPEGGDPGRLLRDHQQRQEDHRRRDGQLGDRRVAGRALHDVWAVEERSLPGLRPRQGPALARGRLRDRLRRRHRDARRREPLQPRRGGHESAQGHGQELRLLLRDRLPLEPDRTDDLHREPDQRLLLVHRQHGVQLGRGPRRGDRGRWRAEPRRRHHRLSRADLCGQPPGHGARFRPLHAAPTRTT